MIIINFTDELIPYIDNVIMEMEQTKQIFEDDPQFIDDEGRFIYHGGFYPNEYLQLIKDLESLNVQLKQDRLITYANRQLTDILSKHQSMIYDLVEISKFNFNNSIFTELSILIFEIKIVPLI
jgi:hypothetical protein